MTERREKATEEAWATVEAELSSLHQQVVGVTSLTKRASDEAGRRRTLQREHSLMLEDLRVRANRALDTICKESIARPYEADDAGYLRFFTQVVTRLEGGAARARRLIMEKIRDILGCAFSHVFSHLLRSDPDFDFNSTIAPVPRAIMWIT